MFIYLKIFTAFVSFKIAASFGKCKTDLVPSDADATAGEVTAILANFIQFNVARQISDAESSVANKPSVFSVLMMSSKNKQNLPAKFNDENNNKNKLKNSLIGWLQYTNVGWSVQEADLLGVQFINTTSSVLWDIDGNHATLKQRGFGVPDTFSQFSGFNQPELKKKEKN